MRTCCCCRAPQKLRGCREFATNWDAPNTIDHDLSPFRGAWLRPHLKEKWATAFSASACPHSVRLRRFLTRLQDRHL